MFNNIIYLIIVLVIFNVGYPVDTPFFSPLASFFLSALIWINFAIYCRYRFSRTLKSSGELTRGQQSNLYQSAVTRLSILAILVFIVFVYFFNLKYWLLRIPGFSSFSILSGMAGVLVFFALLCTIWYFGYPAYCVFFDCSWKRHTYIWSNLRLNIPILFPWAILTVCFDLLSFIKHPVIKGLFESELGQFTFIAMLLFIIVLFLPPVISYWWGCSSLPATEKRKDIEDFFRKNGFKYREILRWPMFGGRISTAGVMGLIPRFRYVLVTDSLLNLLSEDEIKAVMAHEMGHVKYKHILFYLSFLLGYMVISFGLFEIFFYATALNPWMFGLSISSSGFDTGLFYLFFSIPIILSIIIYFRYIMGFFMRNFERQADLYSARVMGDVKPTIMSLEKIARFSGIRRDQPSWHHFSIAQRVDFLWNARIRPWVVKRYMRRLVASLVLFLVLISSAGYALNFTGLQKGLRQVVLTDLLNRRLTGSPEDIKIYMTLAYIHHESGDLGKAKKAYENIIELKPDNALALNNLAWILATAGDKRLRNYPRALDLAKRAVEIDPSPTFLDTLAEAYYANGLKNKAMDAIKEALEKASRNRDYLLGQLNRFSKNGHPSKKP